VPLTGVARLVLFHPTPPIAGDHAGGRARGPVRALTFVVNRAGSRYTGPPDEPAIARHLASAGGQLGTRAECLTHTLVALDALDLSDGRLTRLARLAGCA